MSSYYLLALGTFAVFAVAFLILNKQFASKDVVRAWLYRGLSLFLGAFFALRYLSNPIVLIDTVGLNINSPFGINGVGLTAFSTIMIWLTFAAQLLLFTYGFYKNKIKTLTPLVKYFASAVFLLDFATINVQIQAMGGIKALESVTLQGLFFSLETGVALAICLVTWINNRKVQFDEKGLINGILIALGMIAVTIPNYAIQVLFGWGPRTLQLLDLSFEHRLVLYVGFIVFAGIIAILHRYDYDHKRYALLYMSIATVITFCYKYSFEQFTVFSGNVMELTNWPLHLCHTAMFIVPLCLAFKLDKVFYFTLFINVLGAFFAMAMPNTAEGMNIFSASSFEFWINHYCACFMPIVVIALKIYPRPKMNLFIYSLIAFACYYALVLFLNAYLTNWDPSVDFFFINSDFVADKLGKWAEDLRLITATVRLSDGKTMVFYPLYQSLYFLVYVGLSFAMWFLYELAFQVEDLYVDIFHRNKKIKADRLALEVSLAGRNISEPINMEGKNKLILRNFSKQYSTSDVFAVHNANLEIEGGQIFGFLGPNGAGKSTIIKSIVGIQPITSGSIEVCGYDVDKQPVGAKLQTGFVPDHYALYENLTGREYVNYIADLYNVSKEDREQRIEEFVQRFCLQGSFDNPIKTYSHGMKQKITIMSALVHNPKLWILDEPLTGLDPESIFQVKEAMKAHAAAGNIVFFSSHIIDVVERICDRIAIIKKGHILCERSVKELEEQGIQLENYYMSMIENTEADATLVDEKDTVEA